MTTEIEVFVPGRVCLLGEHTDWASTYHNINDKLSPHGQCLVYGTDVGLFARASKNERTQELAVISTDSYGKVHEANFPWDAAALRDVASKGTYFSYIAGVAAHLLTHPSYKDKVGPIHLNNYKTTLPMGKGLSSSAAVCVLVAKAFNELFSLGMTTEEIMHVAYEGEVLTPSKCGKMDQCVAFGRACVNMRFHGGKMKCEPIPIPDGVTFYFVVADLNAGKDTKMILSALNSAYPEAKSPVEEKVQHFLGNLSLKWTAAAEDALRNGNPEALGQVLVEAQKSFREHMIEICPDQLTSPKLYRVLADERLQPHIYGGKGVGSQGDGSIQFLCKNAESQKAVCEILKQELDCTPFPMNLKGSSMILEEQVPTSPM
jgi:galactokinase